MKKLISTAVALMLLAFAVGCNANISPQVPLEEVLEAIKDQIAADLRDQGMGDEDFEMEELPGYTIIDLMEDPESLPFQGIKGAYEIKAGMLNADTIILLQLTEDGDAEEIIELLTTMRDEQAEFWGSYSPGQAEKISNAVITSRGNYILYAVYENPEAIEAVFEEVLN